MFRKRDFNVLLLGRIIANFGDSLYSIGTMLLVYSLTQSPLYTGLALFITSSAAVVQTLLSPLFDRMNPKRYLVFSQIVQSVLLLCIPILHLFDYLNVALLLLIMFIVSLTNQMIYPVQLSLLPKVLTKEELVTGNAYFTMAYQGSDAAFNALAGFLITLFGIFTVYYIDSVTFLINSIVFLFLSGTVRKLYKNNADDNKSLLSNHFNALWSGLNIWKDKLLFPLLIGVIIVNFSATGIFSNLPFFAVNSIHYSFLMASSGVGVLVGAFLARTKFISNINLGRLYIWGIGMIGVFWVLMSSVNNTSMMTVAISLSLFVLGWMIIGIFNLLSQTIVQLAVAENQIGIAMGSMIGISVSLSPFGALLGGALGHIYDSHVVTTIFSSMFILVAIYWFSQSSIRGLSHINNIGASGE